MHPNDLESFRKRTKIRGKDIASRLTFVINRWEKVVADSASDKSFYRKDFSDMHEKHIKFLSLILQDDLSDDALENVIQSKLREFTDNLETDMKPGTMDAYGYLIADLEAVISG